MQRKVSTVNGAFTTEFAERKTWKLDEGLFNAIAGLISKRETIVDLGAGIGRYVEVFRISGHDIEGFDAIPDIERMSSGMVKQCDLTKSTVGKCYDWALSFEVGEHINPEDCESFCDNVANASRKFLLLSWAVPGQRGADHVNCLQPHVVRSLFEERGFAVDYHRTAFARATAGKGWNQKLWCFIRWDQQKVD